MATKLEKLVRQSTIPLTDGASQLLGTAFFIAPHVAITAAHVIHGVADHAIYAPDRQGIMRALTVRVKHPPTVAPGIEPYPLPDLAILETGPDDFDDVPCVLLARPGAARELLAVGYSRSIDPRDPFGADLARLEYEGTIELQGIEVLKVKQATVNPGMSGAPVLDPEVGAVVGYVKATRGTDKPYGAYVVAVAELQRYEHSVWAQSDLHHRTNPTWRSAKAGDFDGPDPVAATLALVDAVIQDAQARDEPLPEGVDAALLHQTVWLRRRQPVDKKAATTVSFRQRWRSERPLSGLTVVTGDPGLGKSWLLAHQADYVGQQARQHLAEGGMVDDCIIPLRLTCSTLGSSTDTGSGIQGLAKTLVTVTIPHVVADQSDSRGHVATIERALNDGRVLVCLDGLDEMPTSFRAILKQNLLALLALGNAVLVASRPAALPIVDDIAIDNREDFELVGFSARETVHFVRAWLKDRPQAADALLSAFTDRTELAKLAEVPLLLSFFCRLADPAQRHDYRRATLSQLYHDVALHLLSGRWHGDRTPTDTEGMPDPILRMRLLTEVLGKLQDTWRGGIEDIPKSELRTAIHANPAYEALAATAAVRMSTHAQSARRTTADLSDPVLWEFLFDGILVEATDVTVRPTVRFIHPVMREMLLTTYFAELPLDDQLACIDRHRWLDPAWARVIVGAAGLLADPAPLVSHIVSDVHDPWVTQRTLAAQIIAETGSYRDETSADLVLENILVGTKSTSVFERRRAVSALGILLRSDCPSLRRWGRARIEIQQAVASEPSNNWSDVESEITFEVISSLLVAGDDAAIREARALAVSDTCPDSVRPRLIAGLIALNTREETGLVVTLLEGESARRGDLTAFLSAMHAHSHVAVAAAIQLLRYRQMITPARVQIGRALLECGAVGVDGVRAVADDRTMGWNIRCSLYAELLRAAVPDIAPQALRLISNPYPQYDERADLTLALIEDGVTETTPEAALLLSNPHVRWKFREALARALARQGEAGRSLLTAQLYHPAISLSLKVRHICALVEVRDPHGLGEAVKLHNDRGVEHWIRVRLAEALLRYDANLADEEALIELATADQQSVPARLGIITEMIRRAFPSAAMALMSILREESNGIYSWPDVSMRIAESGHDGRQCLEAIARTTELDWGIRCEALLSMGKTSGDGRLPAQDVVDVMPEMWRNRLILGLGRGGLAPDLDAFIDVASSQRGGYRIIYEFLQRAPLDRALVDHLLTTARGLQEHASVDGPLPEHSLIEINEKLLMDLGLSPRSMEETHEQLRWLYRTLETRTGERLTRLMLVEQLDEFETYMESNDDAGALEFLESQFPEYRSIVREAFAELKEQIRTGALVPPLFDDARPPYMTLSSIAKLASVLSEWVSHADARRWDKWMQFTAENTNVIGSDLAREVLNLAVAADPSWGLHESAVFAATGIAEDISDHSMFVEFPALLDWLNGKLDAGDFTSLYYGGAYATVRFPHEEFGWLYAAVGVQQAGDDGLAKRLLRNAGELRPPGERQYGVTVLGQLQSTLGWTEEVTEGLREAYLQGMKGRPLADYQRSVERDPGSAQNHFNLGVALQQAGHHDEAIAPYQQAVALQPEVAARHRALAGAYDGAGRFGDALASIGAALGLDQIDPVSHALHGLILNHLGRHEDAVVANSEATRLSPSNPIYLHNLGAGLQLLQRYDEAVDAFRKARALQPNVGARHSSLASALDSTGQFDDALDSISTALELDSDDPAAHAIHGLILNHMGRYEDGFVALSEAIRLSPSNPIYLHNLGAGLQLLQRYDEAVGAFRKARALQPNVGTSHRSLASALDSTGQFDDALDSIGTALELDSDDPAAHAMHGLILNHMGRYEEAVHALAEAARLDSASSAIKNNLGEALLLAGRPDEAAIALREAMRLKPSNPTEANILLAVAIRDANQDESASLARRALTYEVDPGLSPFRRGELRSIAYLLLGDFDNALSEIQDVTGLRRPNDTLQVTLYDQLRVLTSTELIGSLLELWQA